MVTEDIFSTHGEESRMKKEEINMFLLLLLTVSMPNPKLRGLGKIPKIGEMGAPRTLYASLILH